MIWTKAEGWRVTLTDGRRVPKLVVPAAELVQTTPPLTISDDEVEEVLRRLA